MHFPCQLNYAHGDSIIIVLLCTYLFLYYFEPGCCTNNLQHHVCSLKALLFMKRKDDINLISSYRVLYREKSNLKTN